MSMLYDAVYDAKYLKMWGVRCPTKAYETTKSYFVFTLKYENCFRTLVILKLV